MLLICDLLVNSNNLIGPLLTSYDHRSQMYISNVISSSILCIHAKNGVLGCCQRCIINPLKRHWAEKSYPGLKLENYFLT